MAIQLTLERIDSQKNLTTTSTTNEDQCFTCPGEDVLKLITGKWKPQIMGLASRQPVRFNRLLRQLPGSNKQSVAAALKDLEEANVLSKTIVTEKPLHIEYSLTPRGKSMLSIFRLASTISHDQAVA
jgi:DNA-binding HxlR family transcriptional regulator